MQRRMEISSDMRAQVGRSIASLLVPIAQQVEITEYKASLNVFFIGASFGLGSDRIETTYCTSERTATRTTTSAMPWAPAPVGLSPHIQIDFSPKGRVEGVGRFNGRLR